MHRIYKSPLFLVSPSPLKLLWTMPELKQLNHSLSYMDQYPWTQRSRGTDLIGEF
ncbi:hypothetical protein I79_007803 [Cricetulus griseus]|uniref:Uncharacterized protein n=1 Tax=Cricetulus griseus TaxID=10029 RepID=G3HBH5_CRIGR|nr:hypothetical protein I79_007803 [Cricetulus griseus]